MRRPLAAAADPRRSGERALDDDAGSRADVPPPAPADAEGTGRSYRLRGRQVRRRYLDVGDRARRRPGCVPGGGGEAASVRPRTFALHDYWPDGVDLGCLRRWEAAHDGDIVFDLAGARSIVERAAAHGLELVGEPDLERAIALIDEDGFRYTFLFLAFRHT
jgi:hypothetical protein